MQRGSDRKIPMNGDDDQLPEDEFSQAQRRFAALSGEVFQSHALADKLVSLTDDGGRQGSTRDTSHTYVLLKTEVLIVKKITGDVSNIP